jgi:hypothetical protein
MARYAAYDADDWNDRPSPAQCVVIASDGNGEARRECGFHTLGKQPVAPEKKLRKTIAELEKRVANLEGTQTE